MDDGKRLLLMTDDDGNKNRSSVSVHQVVSNDDLLIEILLRLPVISLFFFKSVSKRWLSLITSPAFVTLHVTRFPNIPPPSGLFLQNPALQIRNWFQHDFVSLDSRIPVIKKKKSSAFTFGCFGIDAGNVEVLQSCNGLVLCVIKNNPSDKIYVYNPSVNMFKILPEVDRLKFDRHSDKIRLAFDPVKSPHYKVVHNQIINHAVFQTRIYSSETGSWIIGKTFSSSCLCLRGFDSGVYWNDAIHWFVGMDWVGHFKLDVEHLHYTTTKPPETLDRDSYAELFESRGCLLLACAADPHPKHMKIYEIKNGYSGWSLRYILNYEDGSLAAFLNTQKMSPVGFHFRVLFIVVGEREEESFVVMLLHGKVIKYNLLLKTLNVLCYIDTHLYKFITFPFIASFADPTRQF